MKGKFAAALTFLVLIVLPAIGWYWMSKGDSLRENLIKELEIKAQVEPFSSNDRLDSIFTSEHFKSKRWLAFILPAGGDRSDAIELQKTFYKNIDSKDQIYFYTLMGMGEEENMQSIYRVYDLPVQQNWIQCIMLEDHRKKLAESIFHVPNANVNKPLALLIDQNGNIRNYYNVMNPEELHLLKKHIGVFIGLKH